MENITRDKEGIHSEYEIKVMLGNLRQIDLRREIAKI